MVWGLKDMVRLPHERTREKMILSVYAAGGGWKKTTLKVRREEQVVDAYPRSRYTVPGVLSQSSGFLVRMDAEMSTYLCQRRKSTEGLGMRCAPKTSVGVCSDAYVYVGAPVAKLQSDAGEKKKR